MNENRIKLLIDELTNKLVDYINYEGRPSKKLLIEKGYATILEQMVRSHLLDCHDETLGVLQAKVFMYEQIISKSNFAPMLKGETAPEEVIEEPFLREMIFTQRQIENLQSKVYEITGKGKVMELFNELLCINNG